MKIIVDKGQQDGKHEVKHEYMQNHGIELIGLPLPVGDYIVANDRALDVINRKERRGVPVKKMDFLGAYSVTIDTKRDIEEIISNICGKQHDRFRDEVILAQNNGIKLYVLVENEFGVLSLLDLSVWENPRRKRTKWVVEPSGERRRVSMHPRATNGDTLAKAMQTMEQKYGVEFLFCHPGEAGEMILKLLERSGGDGEQEDVQP